MDVQPRSVDEAATYRQLFDRSDDYAELCKSWKEAGRTLSGLAGSEVSRMQRRLQRERDMVRDLQRQIVMPDGSVPTETDIWKMALKEFHARKVKGGRKS